MKHAGFTLLCSLWMLFTIGCRGEVANVELSPTMTQASEVATAIIPETGEAEPFRLPRSGDDYGWLTHNLGKITALAFSTDGARLATAHAEGDVALWEAASGEQIRLLPHPDSGGGAINAVSFSAAGDRLAVADSSGGQITVWDVDRGEVVQVLTAEPPLIALAFSPDDSLLVAGKSSGQSLEPAGRTFVWQTEDWQLMHVLEDAASPVAFTSDGRQLITRSGVALVVWTPDQEPAPLVYWDLASGQRIAELPMSAFAIWLASSPDGKMLAVNVLQMGPDVPPPATLLLDAESGEALYTLPGPDGTQGPDRLAFSPDSSLLVASYQPDKLILWDTSTGTKLRELQGPADWLQYPVFSPDGRLLAAASSDGRLLFWETR